MDSQYLLITSIPPGEAPTWVREKWVGLSLPLAQRSSKPQKFFSIGVLSSPKSFLGWLRAWLNGGIRRESGFIVESQVAIEILSKKSPEAAEWWQKNTPKLLKPRHYFLFQKDTGYIKNQSSR